MENLEVLNKAKEIINLVEARYNYFYRRYERLRGSCMDGGFYNEIETVDMSEVEYAEFKEVIKEIEWLERHLYINIKGKNEYVVDNR